jgi:type 1 fimbria pilin
MPIKIVITIQHGEDGVDVNISGKSVDAGCCPCEIATADNLREVIADHLNGAGLQRENHTFDEEGNEHAH